ncbi:MAG: hypothetical protein ACTSUK_08675, partial [Promethearchaeota archaeon]
NASLIFPSLNDLTFTLIMGEDGHYSYFVNWTDINSVFSAGTYQAHLILTKDTYTNISLDIAVIINDRIIDLAYGGDIINAQITKIKGDVWNLTVQLKDTSRYFIGLENANVSLIFSNPSFTFDLVDQKNGIYSVIVNWDDIKSIFSQPGLYSADLVISKEYFASISVDISLFLSNREIDMTLEGDFKGKTEITKVNGETFTFSVDLTDNLTQSPLLNATVTLKFPGDLGTLTLTDENGDGIYTATRSFTKDEVNAFFRDQQFQAVLSVNAENFTPVSTNISIVVSMEEIAPGLPTFYLLLGIAGILIFAGAIGGYMFVQYARIPAFVKLINKTRKNIAGKKSISDENLTLTVEEEMVEKFGDLWELLDLDLKDVLDLGSKGSAAGNLAPGEESTGGL